MMLLIAKAKLNYIAFSSQAQAQNTYLLYCLTAVKQTRQPDKLKYAMMIFCCQLVKFKRLKKTISNHELNLL